MVKHGDGRIMVRSVLPFCRDKKACLSFFPFTDMIYFMLIYHKGWEHFRKYSRKSKNLAAQNEFYRLIAPLSYECGCWGGARARVCVCVKPHPQGVCSPWERHSKEKLACCLNSVCLLTPPWISQIDVGMKKLLSTALPAHSPPVEGKKVAWLVSTVNTGHWNMQ